MAITNLTNTTWIFNDIISEPPYSETSSIWGWVYIEFYYTDSNGFLVNCRRMGTSDQMLEYKDQNANDPTVYNFKTNIWDDNVYKTITITGGTDATNPDLITWLQENATQVIEELPSSKETYFSIMSELAQTIAEKTGAELPLSIDEMIDALAPKKYTVTVKAYMENAYANVFQTSLSANGELLYVNDSTKLYHNGTEITSKEYVLNDVEEVIISRYQGSFGAYRIDDGDTIYLDNGIFGGLDVNSVTIPITKDTVIYIGGGD